jgi:beta-lactam-binding protein with PASTA domain
MALTGLVIGGGGTGTGSVGVPDVLDLPQAEAEARLRDLGLVPRIQTIEAEGTEGTVFSQNPAARTIRARGTVVTLVVIKAPVVPPNLGQQLAEIKSAVDGVGTTAAAVGTAVAAVDTKVDGVGTAVAAVGTTVDGIGTKVDGIATKVDTLTTAVAAVETDAAADTRQKAILAKLDELARAGTGGSAARGTGTTKT